VLELSNDRPELQTDPDWRPEEAIEGLRAMSSGRAGHNRR